MTVRIRKAQPSDVEAISAFGAAVVPAHYAPILGAAVAQGQLTWWAGDRMASAVGRGRVHVAVRDPAGEDTGASTILGVVETGEAGDDQVVWKLYLEPGSRGRSWGSRLLAEAVSALPDASTHVLVEHFAANARAGTFYEREGFEVIRSDPGSSGDPRATVVWRRLDLPR